MKNQSLSAKIKNELIDTMVLGRKYDLKELYVLAERLSDMNDYKHKVRSVLAHRKLDDYYFIIFHGNAIYSLERC